MSRSRIALIGLVVLAIALGPLAGGVSAQQSIFIPLLVYRTGPYAPSGIPIANGLNDYLNLVNERDGGINGVKLDCTPATLTELGLRTLAPPSA